MASEEEAVEEKQEEEEGFATGQVMCCTLALPASLQVLAVLACLRVCSFFDSCCVATPLHPHITTHPHIHTPTATEAETATATEAEAEA